MLTLTSSQIAGLDATAQAMLRALELSAAESGRCAKPASWSLPDAFSAPSDAALAFATEGMDEGDALLMRLLLPAFRATASMLQQTRQQHDAFDALGQPIVVVGPEGRTTHRTPAFEALLAHESNPLPLTAAIAEVARALMRAVRMSGMEVGPQFQKVRTGTGTYALRAALASAGAPATSLTVVVTVTSEAAALPEASDLEARFGLTRREAEVALLLAEGLPNDDLAERLFISPHTARRHTERVLSKLRVGSRSAVARRMLEG